MREIKMFQSDDGAIWHSRAQAESRDRDILVSTNLEKMLSKPHPSDMRGWIQQSATEVALFRASLVAAAKAAFSNEGGFWDELSAEEHTHPHSYATRLLAESGKDPLHSLWWRANCIDENGREWEQVYFRINPNEGLKRWPEPTA